MHSILSTVLKVLLLVPVLILLYLIGIAFYRLTLHPLAKYPGPLLGRLTNAYAGYHAYKQDTHINIWRCHERYGAFVRYGPDRLLINRQEAVRDIYIRGSNFYKGSAYEAMRPNPAHSVFNAYDKATHRRKRRIIIQGFSDAALRASEQYILRHVKNFCSRLLAPIEDYESPISGSTEGLPTEWTAPHDLSTWSNYLTLDVISDLTYGRSFQLLEKPGMRFVANALKGTGRRMAISFQFPAAFRAGPSGQWLDLGTWLLPNINQLRTEWVMMSGAWCKARIEAGRAKTERKDMMSFIIAATDPETNEQLSAAEIMAESYTLITAGGDTTSVAISSTFFYLSRNTEAYAKAAAEVRSAFTTEDDMCMGPALSSCTYLHACLDEAMRMSPPASAPLYREAGSGGAMVCGEHIREGMSVGVGHYAMHHNPEYFVDPFEYRPERWLKGEDDSIENIELMKAAFNPFSKGSRGCVAMSLAYLEMTLAVARILWLADFQIPNGPQGHVGEGNSALEYGRHRANEFQLYDVWGSDKKGPFLQFKRRVVSEAT